MNETLQVGKIFQLDWETLCKLARSLIPKTKTIRRQKCQSKRTMVVVYVGP